ncbi:MAG: hypothetical protein P4L53_09085 [Candidatus Obscuribacterales bacterium]|nr:hypothetical protein [Candidatus Obscuribacterales bacterium]
MRLFTFVYTLLFICCTEAGWLVAMCGGTWLTFVPMFLLVAPALLAGVDVWHFISDKLPPLGKERSEFVELARFIACWLITSVPATVALLALYWWAPQMLTKFHSGFDCWRMAMSICIWHGFLSLALLVHGKKAFSISYFVASLKHLSQHEVAA